MQRRGPWLYNKQTLLVLKEADDVTHSYSSFEVSRVLGANQRASFLLHDETYGLIPRKFVG